MLDSIRGALRSAIGAAEHVEVDLKADVEAHSPAQVEAKLDEVIVALHRAVDSAERHVDVVDVLVQSLGPLTDSVTRLTEQINLLVQIAAPLAAAERGVSLVEAVLHRRRPRPHGPPGGPGGPVS